MKPAPIILFAYRRPDHAERSLAALAANPEARASNLIAFLDGPRDVQDQSDVEKTRCVLRSATGFASVRIVERQQNVGLAQNISQGLTEILEEQGKAIVVEDDLEVSPAFLRYMNDGLTLYNNDERVASIHGYVYPTGRTLPSSFFLRGADCWGWATWSRAWKHYDSDAATLTARMRQCTWRGEFSFSGAYPYARMLKDAAAGRIDSWAVRWYASTFLDGMYTLYPGISLVLNKGHDGTGTHSRSTARYDTMLSSEAPRLQKLEPSTNETAYEAFRCYFLSLRPSLARRVFRRMRDIAGAGQIGWTNAFFPAPDNNSPGSWFPDGCREGRAVSRQARVLYL